MFSYTQRGKALKEMSKITRKYFLGIRFIIINWTNLKMKALRKQKLLTSFKNLSHTFSFLTMIHSLLKQLK